jgi:hypothetical protein
MFARSETGRLDWGLTHVKRCLLVTESSQKSLDEGSNQYAVSRNLSPG